LTPHTAQTVTDDAPQRLSRSELLWVVALSVPQLITWGSVFYGFALFLQPMEAALGANRAQMSLAFSLALLAEGLLAFAVGRAIDRGHARAVMTLGSLIVGLGLLALSQVTQIAQLYVVWTLLGAALAATLYAPAFVVLMRRFEHHYRQAIIVLTLLGGLASTVFIPLVDLCIDRLGWPGALWLLAALQWLVCAPLHAWLLAPRPADATKLIAVSADIQAAAAVLSPQSSVSTPLRAAMRTPTFVGLAVFSVLLMGVTAALPAHWVSLLRESGLPEAWAIWIPASVGVLQVVGRLGLWALERRVDVHRANVWVAALVPASLAVLLLGLGHPVAALVFVLLYGLGNGMLTIVKGTAMALYVSREHAGALNGVLGVPQALARAALPWSVGALYTAPSTPTASSGYVAGLVLLLATSLIGVAGLVVAVRRSGNARVAPK
jgi:MFS family permease